MKKIIMLLACAAVMSVSAFAQSDDLFNQGKAMFDKFDDLYKKAIIDQEAGAATLMERSEALMQGFDLLQQALKADTVPEIDKKTGQPKLDKNGNVKVKTKNSAKIVTMLSEHFNDIGGIGDNALNAHNYDLAFRAYKAYADLADAPFAKKANINMPDTVKGLVRFLETVSAYEVKNYDVAYEAVNQALALNYHQKEPQLITYYNACMSTMVQPLVDEKKYDEAIRLIDGGIAKLPNDPHLLLLKGSVIENQSGSDEAMAFYHRISELDPNNIYGYFHEGRCIYEKAIKEINDNPTASSAALGKLVGDKLSKSRELFIKARDLDLEKTTNAQEYIDDIDYKLNMYK